MARANLYIKEAQYTGVGTDSTNITSVGFQPDMLIVKDVTSAQNTVFRTKEMRGDITGFLSSTNSSLADRIQNFQSTGFQVGTTSTVNTLNDVYQYIAIHGAAAQSVFRTGNYRGSGADNRNFTDALAGFTPDLVFIQQYTTGQTARMLTSTVVGDNSLTFDAGAAVADTIQNVQSNGFQLGTNASVNTSGTEYVYTMMKATPGILAVGKYTGTGVAMPITGVGFQPDIVIVKNQASAVGARLYTASMVTNAQTSQFMSNTATDATGITALGADGFTVSTGASVNNSGSTLHWIAMKSGNFNVPLSRATS